MRRSLVSSQSNLEGEEAEISCLCLMILPRTVRRALVSTLLLSRCTSAAFVPPRRPGLQLASHAMMQTQKSVEVEQKFQLSETGSLDSKLISLGFESKATVRFVDWYFDTEACDLSTNDLWLRYREKGGKGQWELKVGKSSSSGVESTTIYEEIEGDQACVVATDFLLSKSIKDEMAAAGEKSIDGFEAPELPPQAANLHPFCRLETTRSSWVIDSSDHEHAGLQVDLDSTNTGHTVGEVETMCSEDEIEIGRTRVQRLISILSGHEGKNQSPAVGKLEHYLMKFRPEHFEACVSAGVISNKTQ